MHEARREHDMEAPHTDKMPKSSTRDDCDCRHTINNGNGHFSLSKRCLAAVALHNVPIRAGMAALRDAVARPLPRRRRRRRNDPTR